MAAARARLSVAAATIGRTWANLNAYQSLDAYAQGTRRNALVAGPPYNAQRQEASSRRGTSTRSWRNPKATASSFEWTRSLLMMFWTWVRSVF